MQNPVGELNPPQRILLGPGPSNAHPRVLRAMSTPLLGHLDPAFIAIMDETQALLRAVFKTKARLTLPVSGTGSAGMEAALVNLLEPGDTIVIGVNGLFGERMVDVASRCGAKVAAILGQWGSAIDPSAFEQELKKHPKVKAVAVVHAETSTGVLQPLTDIAKLAHQHDALLIADCVTSLAGVNVDVDGWGIDVCYSGTQKCLSCPPGLSPITFNEAAQQAIAKRKTKVQSWYLDMTMIQNYWADSGRLYHHTAPISMVYGLREALRVVVEEGLEPRFKRHEKHARALYAGLQALGLTLVVADGFRAPSLTTVHIPEGVNDGAVRAALLNEYGIEIGGGLGPFKGMVWRLGLMGYSSTPANTLALLSALEHLLPKQGFEVAKGAGVAAASKALA